MSCGKAAMTRPPSPRLPTTTPARPAAAPVRTVTGLPMQAWAASAWPAAGSGVDEAGAGGGMVGRVLPDAVAEPDAEHDAAVADRDVGVAVGVDAVRVGSDARLLDGGRQVHVDEPEGRRRPGRWSRPADVAPVVRPAGCRVDGHACSFCGSTEASTARLASGSSMMANASAGPLMIVDGPGP